MSLGLKFEVDITRDAVLDGLGWPEPGAAGNEGNLGGNRSYCDLRRLSWAEAKRVANLECEMVERIGTAHDPAAEVVLIEDELCEDPEGIYGLDIGVAATVTALSAAGCVPCASCNAGALGGSHHESHPLVAFFARRETAELLLQCAEEAGAGLCNGDYGCLVVYADGIDRMMSFAGIVIRRRKEFRVIRRAASMRGEKTPPPSDGQLSLL